MQVIVHCQETRDIYKGSIKLHQPIQPSTMPSSMSKMIDIAGPESRNMIEIAGPEICVEFSSTNGHVSKYTIDDLLGPELHGKQVHFPVRFYLRQRFEQSEKLVNSGSARCR